MEAAEKRFLLNGLSEIFLASEKEVHVNYFHMCVFVNVKNRHGSYNSMAYDWKFGCLDMTDMDDQQRRSLNHCMVLDQVRIWAGLKKTTCIICHKPFAMHEDCSVVEKYPEDHVCESCIKTFHKCLDCGEYRTEDIEHSCGEFHATGILQVNGFHS